ncbi:MAG: ABC transporter ATP-binding protein [Candidatus Eisenbacteria bacterium]|uniref:ABC transporter ATP-binding protein n=1 Tax=Eiseniibacteriota bacterium TaxID=2212470 RepID=A0A7Y2EBZ6_UNCEI|nr:ABC transporter ATP-binding protein [Candidatus Eisenbacteria bacterium]
MPENPYFYDYLTPTEFLDTCASWYGMSRQERKTAVPEVLERVGLDPKEKRRLRKFSKGMLQRIGMAQAIIHDPKMVILDEPMSGLDPQGRSQFRDIILGLKREGKTVLFASHILSDVEMICDRVGILNEGRITRITAMEDLLSSDDRSYEIEVTHLPETLIEHLESEGKIRTAGPRNLVRAESEEELEERIHQIFTAGGKLISVRHTHVDLEEVFLAETSGLRLHDSETTKKGAA